MSTQAAPLASQIDEARKQGYSDEEIMGHLARTRRDLAPKMREARDNGYSAQDVIGHLANDPPPPPPGYTIVPPPPPGFTRVDQDQTIPPPPPGFKMVDQQAAPPAESPSAIAAKYEPPIPGLGVSVPGAVEMGKGFLKGAASTMFHGGDLIRRSLGMDRVIQRPEVQEGITASNPLQSVGKTAEQAAEFAIPSGLVGTGAKLLSKAPTVARVLGRAALEGASAAGVAGAQTGGDPTAMRNAGLAAGGTSAAMGGIAAIPSDVLKSNAAEQYAKVLAPTTRENKLLTTKVTPELMDRGVTAWTRKGLGAKFTDQVARSGEAIEDAIQGLPADAALPANDIYAAIDKAAQDEFTIPNPNKGYMPGGAVNPNMTPSPEAASSLEHANALKQILKLGETVDANGNPVLDSRFVRSLRQSWDQQVAAGKGFTTNDLVNNAKLAAYRTASGALREQFAQAYPDIAALNKEYTLWRNAQKVMDATLQRRIGQAKPLGEQIAENAGMVMGGANGGPEGALLGRVAGGRLVQLMRSPKWQTVSAVQKNRLADLLASGSPDIDTYISRIAEGAAAMTPTAAPPSGMMPPPGQWRP